MEAENKELGARIDAMGKNEGVQNGPGISFKEEGDLEEVWGDCMEVEDDDECRSLCFKGNAGDARGVNAASAARGGDKEERSHA